MRRLSDYQLQIEVNVQERSGSFEQLLKLLQ